MYACYLSEITYVLPPISLHRGPKFGLELLHSYVIFKNCTLVDLNFCPAEEQLKL